MANPAHAFERACDGTDDTWCDGFYTELCEFDDWSHCTTCTGCTPNATCDHPTCIFDHGDDEQDPLFQSYQQTCLVGNCTDSGNPICQQLQSVAWDTMNCEQYDFTYCHFLIAGGDGDPGDNQLGPTGALAYYDRICSRKGLDIIPCTQHLMQRDEQGREWILRTIDF